MKKTVLCITRPKHLTSIGIHSIALNELQYHIMARDLVDSPNQVKLAMLLPQILGYGIVHKGSEILTYSRHKGTEKRLQAHRSIGFGGHVDFTDITNKDPVEAIYNSIRREFKEELGVKIQIPTLNRCIIDTSNEVGSVHVGLPFMIELDKDTIQINQDEIHDSKWIHIEDIRKDIDSYESWSKMLLEVI